MEPDREGLRLIVVVGSPLLSSKTDLPTRTPTANYAKRCDAAAFDGILRAMPTPPGKDAIRSALRGIKEVPVVSNFVETQLREKCPNFMREMDERARQRISAINDGGQLPELAPADEKFVAYHHMAELFTAALFVASYGFANYEGQHGMTIDQQLQALEDWFFNDSPPQWLQDREGAQPASE